MPAQQPPPPDSSASAGAYMVRWPELIVACLVLCYTVLAPPPCRHIRLLHFPLLPLPLPLSLFVAYVLHIQAVEVSLMTATAGEPLGYTNTRVGQLVVRGADWAAKDGDDDGGAGHLGVVESVVSAGAAAGVQTVRVRWLKTGVETEAQLQGGKPAGCRTFCVAVVDIAAY